MPCKKSEEQFINEIYQQWGSEYELMGEYINSVNKVEIFHCVCENSWNILPGNILKGVGCPICAEEKRAFAKRKTNDLFLREVCEMYDDEYSVVDGYGKNNQDKINIKHNVCGTNYFVSPSNFLKGRKCPICAIKFKGASQRSNIDKFKELVYNLVRDEYFVLGEYKNARTKTLVKHNICNFEWEITPDKFRQGQRCPKCNESKGEKMLNDVLLFHNLRFIPQHSYNDCKYIRNLRFDFYLIDYNLCIEIQGPQHFEPIDFAGKGDDWAKEEFRKNQIRDQIKRDYCFNNSINLLEIPYTQFNTIESILESELSKLCT